MPFDGAAAPSTSVTILDRMIHFFERPQSWSKGTLYKGNSRNPDRACLKGVLNLMVYGDARDRPISWFRRRPAEWTRIDMLLKSMAREFHGRSRYTIVNDINFFSRRDAIDFLMIARDRLQTGDLRFEPRLPLRSDLFGSAQ
jgi:hypothetical protein